MLYREILFCRNYRARGMRPFLFLGDNRKYLKQRYGERKLMSYSRNIEIETGLSLLECKNILLKDIQHDVEREIVHENKQELLISTSHFQLWLETLDLDKGDIILADGLGLNSTVRIEIFEIRNTYSLIKLFMQWVKSSNDAAVLIYQTDQVKLIWKDGELIRNDKPALWTDAMIAAIDVPYRDEKFEPL